MTRKKKANNKVSISQEIQKFAQDAFDYIWAQQNFFTPGVAERFAGEYNSRNSSKSKTETTHFTEKIGKAVRVSQFFLRDYFVHLFKFTTPEKSTFKKEVKVLWSHWLENRNNIFVKVIETIAIISEAFLFCDCHRNINLELSEMIEWFVEWFKENLASEFFKSGGWERLNPLVNRFYIRMFVYIKGCVDISYTHYLSQTIKNVYTCNIVHCLRFAPVKFPIPERVLCDSCRYSNDDTLYQKTIYVKLVSEHKTYLTETDSRSKYSPAESHFKIKSRANSSKPVPGEVLTVENDSPNIQHEEVLKNSNSEISKVVPNMKCSPENKHISQEITSMSNSSIHPDCTTTFEYGADDVDYRQLSRSKKTLSEKDHSEENSLQCNQNIKLSRTVADPMEWAVTETCDISKCSQTEIRSKINSNNHSKEKFSSKYVSEKVFATKNCSPIIQHEEVWKNSNTEIKSKDNSSKPVPEEVLTTKNCSLVKQHVEVLKKSSDEISKVVSNMKCSPKYKYLSNEVTSITNSSSIHPDICECFCKYGVGDGDCRQSPPLNFSQSEKTLPEKVPSEENTLQHDQNLKLSKTVAHPMEFTLTETGDISKCSPTEIRCKIKSNDYSKEKFSSKTVSEDLLTTKNCSPIIQHEEVRKRSNAEIKSEDNSSKPVHEEVLNTKNCSPIIQHEEILKKSIDQISKVVSNIKYSPKNKYLSNEVPSTINSFSNFTASLKYFSRYDSGDVNFRQSTPLNFYRPIKTLPEKEVQSEENTLQCNENVKLSQTVAHPMECSLTETDNVSKRSSTEIHCKIKSKDHFKEKFSSNSVSEEVLTTKECSPIIQHEEVRKNSNAEISKISNIKCSPKNMSLTSTRCFSIYPDFATSFEDSCREGAEDTDLKLCTPSPKKVPHTSTTKCLSIHPDFATTFEDSCREGADDTDLEPSMPLSLPLSHENLPKEIYSKENLQSNQKIKLGQIIAIPDKCTLGENNYSIKQLQENKHNTDEENTSAFNDELPLSCFSNNFTLESFRNVSPNKESLTITQPPKQSPVTEFSHDTLEAKQSSLEFSNYLRRKFPIAESSPTKLMTEKFRLMEERTFPITKPTIKKLISEEIRRREKRAFNFAESAPAKLMSEKISSIEERKFPFSESTPTKRTSEKIHPIEKHAFPIPESTPTKLMSEKYCHIEKQTFPIAESTPTKLMMKEIRNMKERAFPLAESTPTIQTSEKIHPIENQTFLTTESTPTKLISEKICPIEKRTFPFSESTPTKQTSDKIRPIEKSENKQDSCGLLSVNFNKMDSYTKCINKLQQAVLNNDFQLISDHQNRFHLISEKYCNSFEKMFNAYLNNSLEESKENKRNSQEQRTTLLKSAKSENKSSASADLFSLNFIPWEYGYYFIGEKKLVTRIKTKKQKINYVL